MHGRTERIAYPLQLYDAAAIEIVQAKSHEITQRENTRSPSLSIHWQNTRVSLKLAIATVSDGHLEGGRLLPELDVHVVAVRGTQPDAIPVARLFGCKVQPAGRKRWHQ